MLCRFQRPFHRYPLHLALNPDRRPSAENLPRDQAMNQAVSHFCRLFLINLFANFVH